MNPKPTFKTKKAEKMFLLKHIQEEGEMGGTYTTILFTCKERLPLEKKIEKIKKDRDTALEIYNNAISETDKNPDPARKDRFTRTDAEKAKIKNLENELDEKYPLWQLDEGLYGEEFLIEEIPEIPTTQH